jgi:hypothetical protein
VNDDGQTTRGTGAGKKRDYGRRITTRYLSRDCAQSIIKDRLQLECYLRGHLHFDVGYLIDMNPARLFLVTWLILGGLNIYVFFINRNAAFKRAMLPWFALVAGLVCLFFMFISGFGGRLIFLFTIAFTLISYVNIQRIRFCDACGKMLFNYFGLDPPTECSKCGATFR